jgi:uncharacterized protein YecT (DUF1311 family)
MLAPLEEEDDGDHGQQRSSCDADATNQRIVNLEAELQSATTRVREVEALAEYRGAQLQHLRQVIAAKSSTLWQGDPATLTLTDTEVAALTRARAQLPAVRAWLASRAREAEAADARDGQSRSSRTDLSGEDRSSPRLSASATSTSAIDDDLGSIVAEVNQSHALLSRLKDSFSTPSQR